MATSPSSPTPPKQAPTAVECEICRQSSSVLIRCSKCERSHCQSCVDSHLHPCNRAAADEKAAIVAQGYEPAGMDTLVTVSKHCSCGETFEGQFATTREAAAAAAIWEGLHVGKGHGIT